MPKPKRLDVGRGGQDAALYRFHRKPRSRSAQCSNCRRRPAADDAERHAKAARLAGATARRISVTLSERAGSSQATARCFGCARVLVWPSAYLASKSGVRLLHGRRSTADWRLMPRGTQFDAPIWTATTPSHRARQVSTRGFFVVSGMILGYGSGVLHTSVAPCAVHDCRR